MISISSTTNTNAYAEPELLILMPVYNEEVCIRRVVLEWFDEVSSWTENFRILVIDDGSKDQTHAILLGLQESLGSRLEVLSRENRGHGQSCIQGYRIASERQIPFVLQLDSDGQCDTKYFYKFWRARKRFDVVYGDRVKRDDGWKRTLASWILRFTILLTSGAWCVDPNVPYRMMKTSLLPSHLKKISSDFFLANVALAVHLRKDDDIKHGRIPIRFRERYGGEPSVRLNQFGNRASQLIRQIRASMKNQAVS
jgi:dolichol-phosphate mannosyltransferase